MSTQFVIMDLNDCEAMYLELIGTNDPLITTPIKQMFLRMKSDPQHAMHALLHTAVLNPAPTVNRGDVLSGVILGFALANISADPVTKKTLAELKQRRTNKGED